MLEPVTAKEVEIIMISLNQSASHIEAKEGGDIHWNKMMILTAGKKSKINIGEETLSVSYIHPFFIENYFILNFRLSHSYKVPQLIKIEGFKSSPFKLQSPSMYFFCCTAGLRARLHFPKKAKAPFLMASASGVKAITLLSQADLQLGI